MLTHEQVKKELSGVFHLAELSCNLAKEEMTAALAIVCERLKAALGEALEEIKVADESSESMFEARMDKLEGSFAALQQIFAQIAQEKVVEKESENLPDSEASPSP